MKKWIGPTCTPMSVGTIGFLVIVDNPVRGFERWELRDTPPCANQSFRPTLYGWCGSYNGTSTHGRGMAKVVRSARNGRVMVQSLEGEELAAALEELGYPELYQN